MNQGEELRINPLLLAGFDDLLLMTDQEGLDKPLLHGPGDGADGVGVLAEGHGQAFSPLERPNMIN